MSLEIDVRMPLSFPHAPKACEHVAKPFFTCINKMSEKIVPEDLDAGRRGMLKCLVELKAYSVCMKEYEKKNPPKRLRVSNLTHRPCYGWHLIIVCIVYLIGSRRVSK